MQGTAGWAPTLEGQAAPTLWVTGRGSRVVGHGSWVTARSFVFAL